MTDALGQVSRLGLDRQGNIRALIDPAGNITETVFDERGRAVEVRAPDGGVTTLEWHPDLHVPVAFIDPLGRTTSLRYDPVGNLVAEIDPAGSETRYFYDPRGQIAIAINANGGVSRSDYNEQGQLTRHTDCSGYVTQYAYDRNGWIVTETNALGEPTRFVYDPAGRLIRQTLPDASEERYDHDIAGRLTAFIDGENHRTEFRLARGLLAQRDALGQPVDYLYDRSRRLVGLVNENRAVYRFTYDAIGRITSETRFDGRRFASAGIVRITAVETIEEPGSGDDRLPLRSGSVGRPRVRSSATTRAVRSTDVAGQRRSRRTDNPPVDVQMACDEAGAASRNESRREALYAIRHTLMPWAIGSARGCQAAAPSAPSTTVAATRCASVSTGNRSTEFERDACIAK